MVSHAQILKIWNARARIVATAIASFAGASLAYCGNDPRVETVVLDSRGVTQIPLWAGYVTTVLSHDPCRESSVTG